MKKTMIMLCLALVSWGATAQHDHGAHNMPGMHKEQSEQGEAVFIDKNLGMAYKHYIHLKNALTASDILEAQNASAELLISLQDVKGGDKVLSEAKKVAAANSLDDQRKSFNALSNEMAALVKSGKLTKGEIYLDYCPMANGNTGGYWLSNEKEIRNPYFGDKMLKCGSVKETIN